MLMYEMSIRILRFLFNFVVKIKINNLVVLIGVKSVEFLGYFFCFRRVN